MKYITKKVSYPEQDCLHAVLNAVSCCDHVPKHGQLQYQKLWKQLIKKPFVGYGNIPFFNENF